MGYDYYIFSTLCIRYSVNGEELTQKYCIRDTVERNDWHVSKRDEDFEELEDYKARILQYKKDTIKQRLGWIKTAELFSEGRWLCVNSAKELYLDFIRDVKIPEDSLVKVYKDKGYRICNDYDMLKLNEDDPSDYTEIVKNSKGKYIIRTCANCDNYSDGCNYCDNNSEESESESYIESEKENIVESEKEDEGNDEGNDEKEISEEDLQKRSEKEENERLIKELKEKQLKEKQRTQYMPTDNENICYNCQIEKGIKSEHIIDSNEILYRCVKHIARMGTYRTDMYKNSEYKNGFGNLHEDYLYNSCYDCDSDFCSCYFTDNNSSDDE